MPTNIPEDKKWLVPTIQLMKDQLKQLDEDYRNNRSLLEQGIVNLENQLDAHVTTPKGSTQPFIVRRGQYSGMDAAQALLSYLNDHDGGPVSIATAARDLKMGGSEPDWQPDRYERNLKMVITGNPSTLRYTDGDEKKIVELVVKGRKSQ